MLVVCALFVVVVAAGAVAMTFTEGVESEVSLVSRVRVVESEKSGDFRSGDFRIR